MGLFDGIRAAKDAVAQGLAQGLSGRGLTEEQLAALTPEQRAAYEAQLARAEAEVARGQREADELHEREMASRPLRGPAGEHVYGRDPRQAQAEVHEALGKGVLAYVKTSWKATAPGRRDLPAPAPAAFPDRGAQLTHEWQQRQAALAPYLAPARFPVAFTRIATRARSQVADVATHLAATGLAGRPELAFGAYPVPDHIGGNLGREKNRYLEWDVVHAATEPLPAASVPGTTFLPAEATWVARASRQPSVLDEDVATAFLASAGIGPERCLGIPRLIRSTDRSGGDDGDTGSTLVQVLGVAVFGAATVDDAARDRFAAARPHPLAAGPTTGVHVEVLNWGAVAGAVHPDRQAPFPIPSPFPYLPSTPQELLQSYIDVVGVNPFDCYGVAVTEDQPRDMRSPRSNGWVTVSRNWGHEQPCVDGTPRGRIHGGALVVVTYRDRPEYAEGRARWTAYQHDVLLADLSQRTGARRPVQGMEFGSLGRGTRRLLEAASSLADALDDVFGDGVSDAFADIPPHRYCWPPTDVR